MVRSPNGELYIGEDDPEGYGYDHHNISGEGQVDVVAVRTPADPSEHDFLTAIGLRAHEGQAGDVRADVLEAPAGGLVELLKVKESASVETRGADEWAIIMSFRTAEDLGSIADRLVSSGYADAHVVARPRPAVRVTDPDGQLIEIVTDQRY